MTFKVGTPVYSNDFGEGEVSNISSEPGESHPITVKFNSGSAYRFRLNGQYWLTTPDEDSDIKVS